jgi:hypothetical protein
VNYRENGSNAKHKARLVARGFAHQEEIDYDKTFNPTTKMVAIILALRLETWFK